ncbi:MAG: nucleotidyltransferase domain-containing protein [bacterium]
MRLKQTIQIFLAAYVKEHFSDARIFLFGSRISDSEKGGDIDLLILTKERLNYSDLSRMRIEFYKTCGEQKIDLVNFTFDDIDPFKSIALSHSIEL